MRVVPKGEDASQGLASCGATGEVHQVGKYALGCCSSATKRNATDLLGRPWRGQCCSWGCVSPLLLPAVHKQIRIGASQGYFSGERSPKAAAFTALFSKIEQALLEDQQVMTLLAVRDQFVQCLREEGLDNSAYHTGKVHAALPQGALWQTCHLLSTRQSGWARDCLWCQYSLALTGRVSQRSGRGIIHQERFAMSRITGHSCYTWAASSLNSCCWRQIAIKWTLHFLHELQLVLYSDCSSNDPFDHLCLLSNVCLISVDLIRWLPKSRV